MGWLYSATGVMTVMGKCMKLWIVRNVVPARDQHTILCRLQVVAILETLEVRLCLHILGDVKLHIAQER